MKFNHILFPIDFSEHSRALNRQVASLASYFGSEVTLLHVFEIPTAWYGTIEAPMINNECFTVFGEGARQRLNDYKIDVPESRLKRVLAEGDAAWQIDHYVKENNVDLVVMGSHGHGALGRLLLGSIAMKALHDLACPIWIYHHYGAPLSANAHQTPAKNIVCSLELSEEATSLLRFTKELAGALGANARLVHVIPGIVSRPERYLDTDFHAYLKDAAEKTIAKLQQEAGTDFPLTLSDGSVVEDITEFAQGRHADLVVIGRGKTQHDFGALRTHAYEIIRYAHCPVLSYAASPHTLH
jgi:nucleotide-binding universal stress UspA family protein